MATHKALGRGLDALFSASREKATREISATVEAARSGIPPKEFREIPIGKIKANRYQPRTEFDQNALAELSHSIKEHGIAQPLVITETSVGDEFELVMGERRLRAAKMAGLATVPCIIKKVSNQDRFELALIENLQREDLNAMEEALALDNLMKEFNLTQEQVAHTLGVSRSAIANILRFLRLHEKVQEALRGGQISEGHAKILAGISEHSEQLRLLQKITDGKLSVRAFESLLAADRQISEKSEGTKATRQTSPEVRAYEEELQRVMGRRVEVMTSGNKGWVKFAFYSPWDLDNLCKRLGMIKEETE